MEYKLVEYLYRGRAKEIFRAQNSDGSFVVVKQLIAETTTPQEEFKLKHEFNILKKLNSNYVIKAIDFDSRRTSIIFENFNGISLSQYLERENSTRELLNIACELSSGLAEIHAQRVIHKDIKPQNILINPESLQIKYIDFGIASLIMREEQQSPLSTDFEGTFLYIAPEQTGRTNRPIDNRSDIYSLGVLLYQLFTKKLPFESDSALELVHMHIAKEPKSPHLVNRSLYLPLSKIIIKCLSKDADDRYHSAIGLKNDLEKCIAQLEEKKCIEEFELAEGDLFDYFHLSDKLYGRESELRTLFTCFEKVAGNGAVQILMVDGPPGIGKTRFINEIQREIVKKRGRFAEGNFEQFKKKVPYNGVVQILKSLVTQLFAESEESLNQWKIKILEAIGENGEIIVKLIPEIIKIIGEQPKLQEVEKHLSDIRFNKVLANFTKAIINGDPPLAIFLDNLQWSDENTLIFFENLFECFELRSLLFIGSYRDGEIDLSHPLSIMLQRLKKSSINLQFCDLTPLLPSAIKDMLKDSLHSEKENIEQLAKLILDKTGGNPFYVRQFLEAVYKEGLFRFNPTQESWSFDIDEINHLKVTDNVAGIISNKILEYDDSIKSFLKIGAAIGNNFALSDLSKIDIVDIGDALELMQRPLIDNLIFSREHEGHIKYSFAHDKIRQACYQMIEDDESAALHYRIGKSMLRGVADDESLENLNEIVDHLNQGIEVVTDSEEIWRYARLNFFAGVRASDASATHEALNYFKQAITLIGNDCWHVDYKLTFELFEKMAICEMILNHTLEAEKLLDLLIKHSKSICEKGYIYRRKIFLYAQENRYEEALKIAIEALKIFGVDIPYYPTRLSIWLLKQKAKFLFFSKDPSTLSEIKIKEIEVTIILLASMYHISYMINTPLFNYLIYYSLNLVLRRGITSEGCVSLLCYGVFYCKMSVGQFNKGIAIAESAYQLSRRYEKTVTFIEIKVPYYFLIYTFSHSLSKSSDQLKILSRNIITAGHIPNGAYCMIHASLLSILAGTELRLIEDEIKLAVEVSKKYNMSIMSSIAVAIKWFCICIQDGSVNFTESLSEELTEDEFARLSNSNCTFQGEIIYKGLKTYLLYLKGDIAQAIELSDQLMKQFDQALPTSNWILIMFIRTMSICAESIARKKKYNRRELKHNVQIFSQLSEASTNFFPYYTLILAEIAQVEGRNEEARALYQKAISLSKEMEFLSLEALSNERMAYFCLNCRDRGHAASFLKRAVIAYSRWGAKAKVELLRQEHYQLLEERGEVEKRSLTETSTSARTTGGLLDIDSLIQVSQAISQEIVLERLVKKILEQIVVNAGADKGVLLLMKGGNLTVKSKMLVNEREATTVEEQATDSQHFEYCRAATLYAARSLEPLVLNNAIEQGPLQQDPYLLANKVQSIAAIPIVMKGELTGVLYLENRLFKGAFAQERVTLLNVISSQIAISLENAQYIESIKALYNVAERFVPKRYLQLLGRERFEDVKLGDSVKRTITTLFADIRNFTTISEKLTPEQTSLFLNTYLRHMAVTIRNHRGFVSHFLGDGLMALFPESVNDAVDAALEMTVALDKFNREMGAHGFERISAGIGINFGDAMICTLGEEERMEVSIVSDAVNIASRIENLNKLYRTQVLVSDIVYDQLDNRDKYQIRLIDRVILRGKTRGVGIYQVFPHLSSELSEDELQYRALFSRAFGAYEKGDFDLAEEQFANCVEQRPSDSVAVLLLNRCGEFRKNGPPIPWKGFINILNK